MIMHGRHVPKLDSVRSYVLKAFGRSLSVPSSVGQPVVTVQRRPVDLACGDKFFQVSNAARLVLFKFEYDQG